ncbi:hypothetical protein DEU56DRAFT_740020 [Suillus clintonianus]|uniref:uncharacterized protein n=1 Tax=Suillus clintonianus TaxID=1904413 RepID=UPI001B85C612|nr:uncharacterized protein DEU56DRAFT_740020 [Suillus clintonianus]KAG2131638.1 hypothetical protein DEU56DRAFT_740020 [Suillus clintonianus]
MSQATVEDASQPPESLPSLAVATSETARQRRKIAALEEKLLVLESGHAVKQRETNYYMSKGRAIRRIVTLFDNIEDLICENDRRCDLNGEDADVTIDQDRLQTGYIALNRALPWLHSKASDMENEDCRLMIKKLRQGADAARADDTSKLKSLVADWINRELKPDPPVNSEDKYYRGFINDACGKLLCPTELDWNSPTVRAGIRDRADGYIVTEMSWPAFTYEKYAADLDDLEKGLFKSTLLLQAFKAIFTSPSSAREVAGDGDAANVIEANRRAKQDHPGKKVKTHLRFALSSVTSWRSVDGDFDYILFWQNIVDFFERPPGRTAKRNVKRLLAWWTRKVFGTSRRAELSDGAKAKMSVNALARQRAELDDADFDSE